MIPKRKSVRSKLPSIRTIIFSIIFILNNILFYKHYLPSSHNDIQLELDVNDGTNKLCLDGDEDVITWTLNDNKCKSFWMGDADRDDKFNKQSYDVIVVASYNQDVKMDVIKNYLGIDTQDDDGDDDDNDEDDDDNDGDDGKSTLNNEYNHDNIKIIIKKLFQSQTKKYTPKVKFPELNFLQYLSDFLVTESLLSYQTNKTTILLFLDSLSLQNADRLRSIQDVIASTTQTGFGCVNRPASSQYSIFHNVGILRTFSHPSQRRFISLNKRSGISNYHNYGDWLDQLNISSLLFGNQKDIVPVCYGNSFAINAMDVISNRRAIYNILDPMLQELQTYGHNGELREFVERSWATIFSNPLRKQDMVFIKKKASGAQLCCAYMGSLRYNPIVASSHYPFWKGIATLQDSNDYTKLRFTLVLSYCHEDMSWLKSFINDAIHVQDVIIYSKCNDATLAGYSLERKPKVITLPNVGRCDHSYAYFMNRIHDTIPTTETNNHILFFLTASRDITIFQYKSIQEMIKLTLQNGFSCAVDHADSSLSHYHDTHVMKQMFKLSQYKGGSIESSYSNMGEWTKDLEMDRLLPTPYTPVCYCGNFATVASQIIKYNTERNNVWERLERSLSRGDSIEEGHFAERSWAGLLSHHLTKEQVQLLERIPSTAMQKDNYALKGILKFRYD